MASLFLSSFPEVRAAEGPASQPEIIIYTYDSIVAKGGLGPEIFPLFEKKCGCKVRALSSGDGGQLLSRLQLDAERGKPTAHVVLGIDQSLWERAKPWVQGWGKWKPAGYSKLKTDVLLEEGFLPFDYGVFAFMADKAALAEQKLPVPASLSELLEPRFRRQVILQDPRTSTPGLAFVLYTEALAANHGGFKAFWKGFRSQWLTLAPGWDQAYGLFLKKEAPLVWSYTTSQAYHEEQGDAAGRYQALIFKEGQPIQIEGAALVKGTPLSPRQEELRKSFLEFLITPQVQSLIPKKNWMLPVLEGAKLPPSFAKLPRPTKIVRLPTKAAEIERTLTDWRRTVEGAN